MRESTVRAWWGRAMLLFCAVGSVSGVSVEATAQTSLQADARYGHPDYVSLLQARERSGLGLGQPGQITGLGLSDLNKKTESTKRQMFTGAAEKVSPVDVRCMLCQYFTQRIAGDIMTYSAPSVYLEEEVALTPSRRATAAATAAASTAPVHDAAFLELQAKLQAKQPPFEAPGPSLSTKDVLNDPPVGFGGVAGVSSGRYRHADILFARPMSARWDATRGQGPSLEQQQARYQYKQMYQVVYQNLQNLCEARIPEPFLPMCNNMMTDYPQVAEGLHFNDRPDQICMNLNYCGKKSYIYNAPHARYHPPEEEEVPPDDRQKTRNFF